MNIRKTPRIIFLLLFVTSSIIMNAQQLISVDVAGNMNLRNSSPGITIGVFYHLSKRISGGVELNRFFKHYYQLNEEEEVEISAWDFDLNLHYNISLSKELFFYPLIGISHTDEKENNITHDAMEIKRFFSFNTGTGLFLELKKITPFIECMYTWGKLNQRFFLVGVGYELDWGRKHKY